MIRAAGGTRGPTLVDGLLPDAGLLLLSGPPKSFKTLLALQLSIAIATAQHAVLGRRVEELVLDLTAA